MKKLIIALFLCALGGNLALFAQQEDTKRKADFEKFKAEREAFLTKEMGLTEEEVAAFFPLSNELQRKKFELNKDLRDQMNALRKAKREGKKVSDSDYKKLIEAGTQVKIKEAALDEVYMKKFLEVVSAEKIYLYQNAEREFARNMMNKREQERNRTRRVPRT